MPTTAPRTAPEMLPAAGVDGLGIVHRSIAALALLALLRFAAPLLVPIASAAVFWLLLGPLAADLERRGMPAWVAAALVGFVPPVLLGAAAVLALPAAIGAGHAALASIRHLGDLLTASAGRGGTEGMVAAWLASHLSTLNGDAATRWLQAQAPEAALGAVSTLMLLFFLLLGQRALGRGLLGAVSEPPRRERLADALREARRGVVAFVGVIGLMNAALAVATGIALAAIGLSHPTYWAVLAFALVFVPYLGPFAVAVLLLVAGADAFGSGVRMLVPAGAFLVLHAIEANVLSPLLMGHRLRLGRPALLVAVMAGAWTWGVAGGLLAVPILIVAAAFFRRAEGHAVLRALLAAEAEADAPPVATANVTALPGRAAPPWARRLPDPESKRRPMRIAFVTETYPPEINGVALTVARAVAHLRSRGHDVDLIRPRQDGERCGAEVGDREWRSSGYPIPVYPAMRFGLARPGTLADRFQATGVELVHVATEGPLGWAAVTAANRLGLPVTSDFRTNFHQYSKYYRLGWLEPVIGAYLRRLHNRTVRSFAPTRQTCRELDAAGFERVELAGRGVDLDRFTPVRRDPALRAAWGAADDAPVLLHVGRLAAEKNVELALEAFRSAARLMPSARMVVVGDGPLRAALERKHPDVRFAGTQTGDALAAHYASADLFLFPSLSDTFGNVTLEALASGLPVVAFDVAAASDLVVDGVNGRVVMPGNRAAFVVAACLLTLRHCEAAPMREAARRTAAALDWDSVLRRFEHQLQATIDTHRHVAVAQACAA